MCECGKSQASRSVSQSLDELEFERGLWFAAQYGDVDRALHLLNNGFLVDKRDAAGYTALHYAARNGHLPICQLLVKRGACVDALTEHGEATALHRAAAVGKVEIVRYLIEVKADGSLKDADGRTALHRATIGGHRAICEALLKVDPVLKDEKDNRGNRAVDYAKNEELITLLR